MTSMNKKKIVFLTGTRADFGKLKSLIKITQSSELFEVHIFATGMHLSKLYDKTIYEIYKSGFTNIYPFINHDSIDNMDRTLAKTIDGFSLYIKEIDPDLIVVHGDRVEAMAGAIVGSLNNILVAHIEGGELSGTIDELIRHSVSKLSHVHLVANNEAKQRLIQMGEMDEVIFTIGSPDLDLMNPNTLPSLQKVKNYYEITFETYAIFIYHPVTTEFNDASRNVKAVVDAIIASKKNYIVIYPNNDLGSHEILTEFRRFEGNEKIKVYPSLRFEYFLRLLYECEFIIGNSSAGIREAPYYKLPTIDIGTRQVNRASLSSIIHCEYKSKEILEAIENVKHLTIGLNDEVDFGDGQSDKQFFKLLSSKEFWKIDCQKQFQDLR